MVEEHERFPCEMEEESVKLKNELEIEGRKMRIEKEDRELSFH